MLLVWENQRAWGSLWHAPALLERPQWSDADGNAIHLTENPSALRSEWELEVSGSTDPEGWQYASVFRHLDLPRIGGRSSCRTLQDFVRRRRWICRDDQAAARLLAQNHQQYYELSQSSAERMATSAAQGLGDMPVRRREGADREAQAAPDASAAKAAGQAAEALLTNPLALQATKARKHTEFERRKGVLRAFMTMLIESIKRHQLWNMMPWDPGAWWVLFTTHQKALAELQQQYAGAEVQLPGVGSQHAEADAAAAAEGQQPPNLLRDMLCAAVHSRASYGFAMQAGHLASVFNFALMHTLHQISFDPASGASAEANNCAVAALAGLSQEDLLMAEWNNSIGRPCHYVCVDRAHHCLVLSIRGSLEVGDVLSDLSAQPMEITMLGVEGKVHEGMMEAATFVHCNAAAALQKAGQHFQGWPLFVTGHSLGGGVAAIVAVLLRDNPPVAGLGPVRCVAISPAAVFSAQLADGCRDFVTSLILRSDAVPRLSYSSVEGIFVELVNASPVRKAMQDVGRKVSQTMDWATKRSPPKKPQTGPGLECLAELTEDERALTAAADMAQAAFEEENTQFRGQLPDGTNAAAAASGSVSDSGAIVLQSQLGAPPRAQQQQTAGDGGRPLPAEAVAADVRERPPKPAAGCNRPAAPAAAAKQDLLPQAASSWLPQLPADWRHLLPGAAARSQPSNAAGRLQGQAGPIAAGKHASKGVGAPPEVEMQALDASSSLPGQAEGLLSAEGPSASESPADKAAAAELAARAAQQIAALRASGTAGPSKAAPGGGSQPSGPFSAAAAAQHGQPQPEGPEGPELESNPGSQAAAWASAERDQAHSAGTASVPDRTALQNALGVRQDSGSGRPEPLYPPGRILWLLDPLPAEAPASQSETSWQALSSKLQAIVAPPPKDAEEQCQALPQPPRLLEVPKEAFSRLLLLPDMLSDHLPDSYLAVLQRL